MSNVALLNTRNLVLPVFAPAAAWVVLHQVNAMWSEALAWSAGVTWLFLPAAIRPLAILLFGVWGAVGLFIGSLVTMTLFTDAQAGHVLAVAGLSALAPLLAVNLGLRLLKLEGHLGGMTARQLLALVVASAAVSVCLHNLYYWVADLQQGPFSGVVPMFVGDLLGTLLVLYAARSLLRLRARLRSGQPR
jgi:hypothetical protein